MIYDLSVPLGSKPPVVLPYADELISDVHWKSNKRLLITVDMNRGVLGDKVNTWQRTISIDTDGNNAVVLFSENEDKDNNYSASVVADYDVDDPDHVFMPLWTYRIVHQFAHQPIIRRRRQQRTCAS